MTELITEHHQAKDKKFKQEEYLKLQNLLYDEIKSLENPWLISDFITIGSPLCHGAYIMAKDYAEFDRRTNYRELPLSPPKIEVKLVGKEIVKDYDRAISYLDEVVGKKSDSVTMRIINHSSQFAFIRWNNIYFTNDYVGGDLNFYFGEGIKNHEFTPNGSFRRQKLPCASHTNYWDKDQNQVLNLLRSLLLP